MEQIFWQIVNMSLVATLGGLGLVLLKKVVGRCLPPLLYCLLWVLVFVRMAAPMALPSRYSLWNCVPQAQAEERAYFSTVTVVEPPERQVLFPTLNVQEGQGQLVEARPLSALRLFAVTWAFVTGALFLYSGLCYWGTRLYLKDGYDAGEMQQILGIKKSMGLTCPVEVWYSDRLVSPLVCGVFRPAVVLPYDMDMEDSRVKVILTHELMHIKRKDNLLRLVVAAVVYVNWFNPMAWYFYGQFVGDMEAACDR